MNEVNEQCHAQDVNAEKRGSSNGHGSQPNAFEPELLSMLREVLRQQTSVLNMLAQVMAQQSDITAFLLDERVDDDEPVLSMDGKRIS